MTDDAAAQAIRRFAEERERYKRAGEAVVRIARELLAPAGIVPTFTSRAKDVESFRAKIAMKRYTDPWASITDKVGARALVHRPGEVDLIHNLIEADGRLPIYGVTDKRTELGLEKLGYSGLHLDLYAPPEDGDTELIPCELQIRTIAQDAWSVVSHKLLYKPEVELPSRDQRAIMRLVALVEVFDEEVERVMKERQSTTRAGSASPESSDGPDLLSVVTAQYARFETNLGHRDLTRVVMDAVSVALEVDGVTDYRSELASFVDESSETLRALYDDYGVASAMAESPDYVLWSQPESIAVLESLEHRANTLLAAWREAELPDAWLQPLKAHTSAQIDLR